MSQWKRWVGGVLAMCVGFGVAQAEPNVDTRATGVVTYTVSKINPAGPAAWVRFLLGQVPSREGNLFMDNANASTEVFSGLEPPVQQTLKGLVQATDLPFLAQSRTQTVQATSGIRVFPVPEEFRTGWAPPKGSLAELNTLASGSFVGQPSPMGNASAKADFARAFVAGPNTRVTFSVSANGVTNVKEWAPFIDGRQMDWKATHYLKLSTGPRGGDGWYLPLPPGMGSQEMNVETWKSPYTGGAPAGAEDFVFTTRPLQLVFDNATTNVMSGAVWAYTRSTVVMRLW